MTKQLQTAQILRRKALEQRLQLSRGAIYNKLDPRSPYYDPTFPKKISLGAAAVGWIESEVNAWVDAQKAASRGSKK